ncbi:MAG: aminopeptidase [Cetobacterium sp.]
MFRKNGWTKERVEEKHIIFNFSEDYKKFLDNGKTEREVVQISKDLAEVNGFVHIDKKDTLKSGDKVYFINRNKNIVLSVIGEDDILNGINYIVSHIDSPRIDIKANPLYEELDLAYMKTHYYGGIKKYQWSAIPLALHGIVILEDSTKINITIGESENDPILMIPDLLPHLWGKSQAERKAPEVFVGEELQILVGSMPMYLEESDSKELIKTHILTILKNEYGFSEEDFVSAELELVPAGKTRDLGLDRSLIAGYGQDDRICAYTSLKAILDLKETPKRTVVCFLADKEETGSNGSTGLQSNYLEYFTTELILKAKGTLTAFDLQKTLWNSKALSSDVNVAMDPIFKGVHDPMNAAKLNNGIVITKYTGSRGKSSTNDADAEYVAEIRNMLNKNDIVWQIGMLGKVDEGGGGTVAMFLAQKGIQTIDVGPALLSMHAPMEISSKLDVYETYRAYCAFYKL